MKNLLPNITARPLAAALIAATLSLPTWAQQDTTRQTTQAQPANGQGGLYADPDPRDQRRTEENERPLPQDIEQLTLGQQIPIQVDQPAYFNFRAQKPGMMTLLVSGLGNTPTIRIQSRDGMSLPNGELSANMVQSLQQRNNFDAQQQNFRGYGEETYGLVGNSTTAWLLVNIPQAGDYTVTFTAQTAGAALADVPQPQRRWAIPIDELQPQQGVEGNDPAQEIENDEPTPFARAEFVELLDAQDIQAEQLVAVQRAEQERQQRQQQMLQLVQNAPALATGQAINVQGNSWVRFTAPAAGFLVVTGSVRNNDLRFTIHSPENLENHLEYIDEDRDNNAGSEAFLYPMSANQTILIQVRCTSSRDTPVRIRSHFEPNAPLPAGNANNAAAGNANNAANDAVIAPPTPEQAVEILRTRPSPGTNR